MPTRSFILNEKKSLLTKLAVVILLIVAFERCQSPTEKNETNSEVKKITPATTAEKKPEILDTGQVWFRVIITKNDSAFMDYEGSWPVFFLSGNSATLQLSKSKAIMSVTDILTIYMNGVLSGKAPVLLSNSEKGTVSMIMMPVTDGAYGLSLSATEGFFTITKNVNSIVSGNFEAKGVDLNKDVFVFKGYFLNAKINPDKI